MCRIIAGTLVAVGEGKLVSQDIDKIFKEKNRTFSGITAPSKGLFLKSLCYPEFAMIISK